MTLLQLSRHITRHTSLQDFAAGCSNGSGGISERKADYRQYKQVWQATMESHVPKSAEYLAVQRQAEWCRMALQAFAAGSGSSTSILSGGLTVEEGLQLSIHKWDQCMRCSRQDTFLLVCNG